MFLNLVKLSSEAMPISISCNSLKNTSSDLVATTRINDRSSGNNLLSTFIKMSSVGYWNIATMLLKDH